MLYTCPGVAVGNTSLAYTHRHSQGEHAQKPLQFTTDQGSGGVNVPHWHTHSQFGLAQKPRQFSLAHTQTLTGWICTETMTVHN